nr:radical SAM protein [Candidatus Gracilibacteria bacterium]
MFLLNFVFGEVYCTLNCDYCMYTKKFDRKFTDKEVSNFKKNIYNLKNFIDSKIPELKVISLTGGEPTLFPEIIEEVYTKFDNKVIRVSTNGTILHKQLDLNKYNPNKIFFAISLDGINLEDNIFRFKNKQNLDNILGNIDTLLSNGFCVELLTVLHPKSIPNYLELIKFLESKYKKEIDEKRLWCIPFELVNYLNKEGFRLDADVIKKFLIDLEDSIDKYKLLSNYKEYFYELIKYYRGEILGSCKMHKWALHIKYLGNTLWTHGKFLLYGCGSRGHKVLGQMNLEDPYEEELIIERANSIFLDKFFKESKNACNKCFDNRHFYGLFLENKLSNKPKIFNYN